jgi:hypothetical protein
LVILRELIGPVRYFDPKLSETHANDPRSHSEFAALQEKAGSGASGSIVVLDLKSQRIHVGRIGREMVALGLLIHGLAAQLTEGTFVGSPAALM